MRNAPIGSSSSHLYPRVMYTERSLHENSVFVSKRQSEHLSPQSIPGTRVYPYPGTTQESVRNSYHHTPHTPISHHIPTSLYIGANNNPHSAVVSGPYRETFQVERQHQEYPTSLERYRVNDSHNAASGSGQTQLIRRRPSLLPHSMPTNEYNNIMGSSFVNRIDRERYDPYARYAPYDSRGKGHTITHSPSSLPQLTASSMGHHGTPIHMIQHSFHLTGHHHSGMTPQQQITQSHMMPDVSDLSGNKRPRLAVETRAPIHQPLLIDTRDIIEVKKEPAYTPQVEAISPTLPNEDIRHELSPLRTTKDEILQNINKTDGEIRQTEAQISKLKKKQQELEHITSKPSCVVQESSDTLAPETKQLSTAQMIYSENKKKTLQTHSQFDKLGPKIELPLYNQPSDTIIYHENRKKFMIFKKKLIIYLKKRLNEKQIRERYLTETYDKLMLSWLKKLEKKENFPTKRAKDIKQREYFEKQFPELRKQREDRERFSRVGQRIRSDAELEEIMDGLQEQELEDKKMRSYAVIPPILSDARYRKYNFINRNGAVEDALIDYKERQYLNVWSDQEKEIFREKFLQHPKNFGLIASYLERKSVADCVQYYYLSKKSENYKQLLRKHVKKRTRALVKAQQQQQQQQQQQAAALAAQQGSSITRPQNPDDTPKTPITSTATVTSTNTSIVTTSASLLSHSITNVIATTASSSSISLGTLANVTINGSLSEMSPEKSLINPGQKCDNIGDETYENENDTHKCCLCGAKVENFTKSRPVTISNFQLYGINNDNVKQGMRVCYVCHFKNVRQQCPIQSCKTPRRKVKRLKMLPQQWFDLSHDEKMFYANELNIETNIKNACPRCVMRIARRIGAISATKNNVHPGNTETTNEKDRWNDEEIEMIKKALKEHGKNWNAIAAAVITKSVKECREFYFNYKYKHNLDKIIRDFLNNSGEHEKNDSDSDEFWNELSDGGDSEETSSAEEGNGRCTSDTASASSPLNKADDKDFEGLKINIDKSNEFGNSTDKLQKYKVLSASQGSLKSDYDSSATMSADEGQGSGENEGRSSPIINIPPRANSAMPVFPPSNNVLFQHQQLDKHTRPASHDAAFDMVSRVPHSTRLLRTHDDISANQKVPPFLINPNAPSTQSMSLSANNNNKEEPTCVRDLIYQAIEMSLQSPLKPGRGNSSILTDSKKSHDHDIVNMFHMPVIKRENDDMRRHSAPHSSDITRSHHSFKNNEMSRPEGLAMVASYSHQLNPSTHSHSYIMESDNYEVQDLSKKDKKNVHMYISPVKDKSGNLNRNDFQYFIPPPAHSNQNRNTPTNAENKEYFYGRHQQENQQYLKSAYLISDSRIGSQTPEMSHPSPPLTSTPSRITPKVTKGNVPPPPPLITSTKSLQQMSQISPKLNYRDKLLPVSTTGGSITHGTPISMTQQSYGQPKYEGLLRQLPPMAQKDSGSITLGTPLHSGPTGPLIDSLKRKDAPIESCRNEMMQRPHLQVMYDHANVEQYYRRTSPTAPHSYSPGYQLQGMYQPNMMHLSNQSPRAPFHKESQLSSKQIMIDFNTSKQMMTRRGSASSEKEIRSLTPNQDVRQPQMNDPKMTGHGRINSMFQNYPPGPMPGMQQSVYSERFAHGDVRLSYMTEKSQSEANLSPTNYSHWAKHESGIPLNRQNVIQQWNTSGSKPSVIQTPKMNSPREVRSEDLSIHSGTKGSMNTPPNPLYTQSLDSFTTLVNTAVAQPSLAVPNADRRPHTVLRNEMSVRTHQKEKQNIEGLEKSLMDMHQHPRGYNDPSNPEDGHESRMRIDERTRISEHHKEALSHMGMARPVVMNQDEHMLMMEQRRRLEYEQYAENERRRISRSMNEQTPLTIMPQSSLRYPGIREPFSREQFERELRQSNPGVRYADHSLPPKAEHEIKELQSDSRSGHMPVSRPLNTELDNEASKLFSQSFQKDNQKTTQSARGFTAANLIDAIITHQINNPTENANGKNTPSSTVVPAKRNVSPTNGVDTMFNKYHNTPEKQQYLKREEVVNIADSPDPDRSPVTSEFNTQNITLGEHINTIITKNYNNDGRPHFAHSMMPIDSRNNSAMPYDMPPQIISLEKRHHSQEVPLQSGVIEGIAAAAISNVPPPDSGLRLSPPHTSWKLRKALQQDKEPYKEHNKNVDERQIIRVQQNTPPHQEHPIQLSRTQSPKKSQSPSFGHYDVEPISPPSNVPTLASQPIAMPTTTTAWPMSSGKEHSKLYRHFNSENADSKKPNVASQLVSSPQTSNIPFGIRPPQAHISPLDYVKNRIVEVMRTTPDQTAGDDPNKRTQEKPVKEECSKGTHESPEISDGEKVTSKVIKSPSALDFSSSSSVPNETPVTPTISTSRSLSISSNSSSSHDTEESNNSSKGKIAKSVENEPTELKNPQSSESPQYASSKPQSTDDHADSTISQSNAIESIKAVCDEQLQNNEKISSSDNSLLETTDKGSCEVTSACAANNNVDKDMVKEIYPDSPISPGEMVIDESGSNLASSTSQSDRPDPESAAPNTTTQQSIITTSDLPKVNSSQSEPEKQTISSSTSQSSVKEAPNQSYSVSSSVTDIKNMVVKSENDAALSSNVEPQNVSKLIEKSPPSKPNVSSTNTLDAIAPSVSPSSTESNCASQSPVNASGGNVNAGSGGGTSLNNRLGYDFSYAAQCITTTASSSIATNVSDSTQNHSSSSNVQSSIISASGQATSTTAVPVVPQYEPLSDDEL